MDYINSFLLLIINKKKSKYIIEFDDGSEWTLSKCLTHANRTSNFINFNLVRSGVKVSKGYYNRLKVRSKIPYIKKKLCFALRSLYLG